MRERQQGRVCSTGVQQSQAQSMAWEDSAGMNPRGKGPSPAAGGVWAGHGSNHRISSQSCLQGF